jgi:hypothetical protein
LYYNKGTRNLRPEQLNASVGRTRHVPDFAGWRHRFIRAIESFVCVAPVLILFAAQLGTPGDLRDHGSCDRNRYAESARQCDLAHRTSPSPRFFSEMRGCWHRMHWPGSQNSVRVGPSSKFELHELNSVPLLRVALPVSLSECQWLWPGAETLRFSLTRRLAAALSMGYPLMKRAAFETSNSTQPTAQRRLLPRAAITRRQATAHRKSCQPE